MGRNAARSRESVGGFHTVSPCQRDSDVSRAHPHHLLPSYHSNYSCVSHILCLVITDRPTYVLPDNNFIVRRVGVTVESVSVQSADTVCLG